MYVSRTAVIWYTPSTPIDHDSRLCHLLCDSPTPTDIGEIQEQCIEPVSASQFIVGIKLSEVISCFQCVFMCAAPGN